MSVIKAEFKGSLLQSSVSHDSSEIILIFWFDAQETFLIIINVETVLLLHIFVQTVIYFQDSLINSSKEQLLFINVFTVFEQWNASLLNRSFNFFKNTYLTDPKTFM